MYVCKYLLACLLAYLLWEPISLPPAGAKCTAYGFNIQMSTISQYGVCVIIVFPSNTQSAHAATSKNDFKRFLSFLAAFSPEHMQAITTFTCC